MAAASLLPRLAGAGWVKFGRGLGAFWLMQELKMLDWTLLDCDLHNVLRTD
jgi:hypothetical protein